MKKVDGKEFCVFKFRPSSHSDDFTIIATYQTVEDTGKATDAVNKILKDMEEHPESYDTDWSPDEAHVSASGNQVNFEVYSAGYIDDVESVVRKAANPEKVECYSDMLPPLKDVGFLLQRVPDGFSDRLAFALAQGYSASAPIQFGFTCNRRMQKLATRLFAYGFAVETL